MTEIRKHMVQDLSAQLSKALVDKLKERIGIYTVTLTPGEGVLVIASAIAAFQVAAAGSAIALTPVGREELFDKVVELWAEALASARASTIAEVTRIHDTLLEGRGL